MKINPLDFTDYESCSVVPTCGCGLKLTLWWSCDEGSYLGHVATDHMSAACYVDIFCVELR